MILTTKSLSRDHDSPVVDHAQVHFVVTAVGKSSTFLFALGSK